MQLLALCRERLAAKLARKEKERKIVAWEFRGHIIFYYIKRTRAGLYRFITLGEGKKGGAGMTLGMYKSNTVEKKNKKYVKRLV